MDMILISDTKLKVMLSPLDMEELALSGDDIDYNNTETRRAFWSILDEAKHKTGFDAAGMIPDHFQQKAVGRIGQGQGGGDHIGIKFQRRDGEPSALQLIRQSDGRGRRAGNLFEGIPIHDCIPRRVQREDMADEDRHQHLQGYETLRVVPVYGSQCGD